MKASMQKLIAMGLCVVLAVGSLTGCGGSSNDAGSASGDGAKTSSSSDKKTFSDLGGMDITVGDWFTSKDTLANRTDEFGKKQNEYWKSIQEKYNFKITRDSVYSYTDAKSDYVVQLTTRVKNTFKGYGTVSYTHLTLPTILRV